MWRTRFLTAVTGEEVACWDLDSSVRSTMHRRWMVPEIRAGRATWDQYSMLAADDEPIEGAVTVMRMFADLGVHNIAVSGTAVSALDITVDWAKRHDVPLEDYLLRPADEPNGEWKVSCVRRLQAAGLVVRLFAEDWGPAAAYIREHTGVPVLGLNPFDDGTIMLTRADLAQALEHRIGPEGLAAEPGCGPELAGDLFGWLEGKLCL